jgi:hypothetical protein
MNKYVVTRARNARVYEVAEVEFPSDDEAVAAAKAAHLGSIEGYDGKVHALVQHETDETVFPDVAWDIVRVAGKKKTDYEAVTGGFDTLVEGYVTSSDFYDLVEELSGLDPDWALDMRVIRSAVNRARSMMERLKKQQEIE